ncbi:MAG: hypothetical protein WCK96_18815 [Methylococcales bacterium]
MNRLISLLTKLEQQSKTKIDPYLAEIQQLSVEEIRAERKRIEARLAKSNCPHCPDCTTPEIYLEIAQIRARLNSE